MFNIQQIQRSTSQTVDLFHARYILEYVGVEVLTPTEKKLLQADKVDLSKYKGRRTQIEESYLFGRSESSVRNKKDFNRLDLKQFRAFMDENPDLFKLTREDRAAIKLAKQAFANDVRRLAGDIKHDVQQNVIEASKIKGTKRQVLSTISTKLAENTKRYSGRIELITGYRAHEIFQEGIAQEILQRLGENAKVYFSVHVDGCIHCKRVYLKPNGEPRIFYLKTLIRNGNNIGRKAKE